MTASLQRAAAGEQLHLITVNNRYSAREALRNADLLIRERVDLVLEFQTYERVAPIIASKFLGANIPVIAIEIPHPGATYFGADNYQVVQVMPVELTSGWPLDPLRRCPG